MRFELPPEKPYSDYRESWHSFFAIFPRQIEYNKFVWMERIERKGRSYWSGGLHDGSSKTWEWRYRDKVSGTDGVIGVGSVEIFATFLFLSAVVGVFVWIFV